MNALVAQTSENESDKDSEENHPIIRLRKLLLLLIGTVFTGVIFEILLTLYLKTEAVFETGVSQPTFAVYVNNTNEGHLRHVLKLLLLFGYKRVRIEDNWDLLWAHDYPYITMGETIKSLKPHQFVNHVPGCGFITNKVELSTTPLPFIPRAFRLPKDLDLFLNYSAQNPESIFVEKHNEHRHILIKSPADITINSSDQFVQEYVRNPLLIDGYKFDIGIYVAITSIDPLRIYIYSGDVLFRFCPVKYNPFDIKNVDKYVVGDNYMPIWEVPSLVKFYTRFGGSMRASFDAYMHDKFLESINIWQQAEDIIVKIVLEKEEYISRIMRSYRTRNFFDLIRFDFIVDDLLQVYLMEANMSPNLSSAHFQSNTILYEQILYNVLNLVGIGSPIRNTNPLLTCSQGIDIITADKNLATHLNLCTKNDCDISCKKLGCDLCLPCLSGSDYNILVRTHQEHLQRMNMKRIFPKPILDYMNYDIEIETQNLTTRNKWLAQWFYGKCMNDRSWCL